MRIVWSSLLLLMACDALPNHRQSSELVVFDQTGSLTVLRWSQGDTGWLKGQGHFRATWWSPSQTPLQFWDHAPADYVDWTQHTRSIALRHRLEYTDAQWLVNSHFDEWNLRVQTPCENSTSWKSDSPNWRTTLQCVSPASVGWLQSYKQSHPIQGWGFLIEHQGTEPIQSHLQIMGLSHTHFLYIESRDDQTDGVLTERKTGIQTAITSSEQQSDKMVIYTDTDAFNIPMGDIDIIGIDDPYEHLAMWERALPSYIPTHPIVWSITTTPVKEIPMTIILRQQGE